MHGTPIFSRHSHTAFKLVLVCLLLGPVSQAVAATSPSAGFPYFQPHYCKNAYTEQQEISIGQKAATEVEKKMKVLPDSSPITKYVQKIGARLDAQAPGYRWPYSFHVAVSKEINAFALPGGAMFVYTGIIEAAQNESQLAGVMAHEISHVVQRHATCNLTKQSKRSVWWGLAGLLSGMVVPGAGGAVAQAGVGIAQNLTYLKMSREDEKQADLLGAEILTNAGYNPHGMVQMFQIIEAKAGSGGAEFLSDHPNPGNRVDYLNKEIESLSIHPDATVNTPEFQKIHDSVLKEYPPTANVSK